MLLEEAHRKHGVYLNVPPQLPPVGTPPEVPDVIFCEKQSARLRSLKLQYAPTHGPPPLSTTGTRGLADMLAEEDARVKKASDVQSSSSSPAVTSGAAGVAGASTTPTDVSSENVTSVRRRPVEENNRFHCSLCAKSFRIRLSADHHIRELHSTTDATVLDGPGPGEIMVDEAPAAVAPTVPTVKKPLEAVVKPAVEYKKLVAIPIPSEEEIDALLLQVWDAAGSARGGDFTPIAEAVAGVADNRKPLSELDLAPSIRATPEGAAPGVKRVVSATATGKFTPIKELSARFANPFGESEEAKLLALLKDEPINPFLPLQESPCEPSSGLVAGTPSLEAARKARPYQCPLCKTAPFRLLDALADHLETDHEVEMSTEEILASQDAIAVSRNPYVVQKDPVDQSVASPSASQLSDQNAASGDIVAPLPDGVSPDVIPPTPPTEDEVSVHLRASSNTVIVGEVVDVQSGFLKARRIIQYVVKTSSCNTTEASADASGQQDEFIVVRVDADGLKFTTDAIKSGMWVMVHGSLRMNRHTDDASRRLHAYPYVQVAAPLGTIMTIE